jgi:serine/threonine-protein kinase
VREQDPAGAPLYPAAGIGYRMARKYARSVGGRLPTEGEWELAARSGNDAYLWVWGIQRPPDDTRWAALFDANRPGTTRVRTYNEDKTQQDVYDLTGNVREWCLDTYRDYAEIIPQGNEPRHPLLDRPASDPVDPARKYVVRGGSFQIDDLKEATTFYRRALSPESDPTPIDLGFRVVIESPDAPVASGPVGSRSDD